MQGGRPRLPAVSRSADGGQDRLVVATAVCLKPSSFKTILITSTSVRSRVSDSIQRTSSTSSFWLYSSSGRLR